MIELLNVIVYIFTFGNYGCLCLIGSHTWYKKIDEKVLRCSECGLEKEM